MRSRVSSMAAGSSMQWLRSVKGVILDMCGVLYDSGEGGGQAIHGSAEAVRSVDVSSPNCVVIGDAADNFSYQNLNEAFRVLIGLEKPLLFSLGQGSCLLCRRYYKETDGLKLDVGVFMKALEVNAADICIGRRDRNSVCSECLVSRRPSDEQHPSVRADAYVDDLAAAVNAILTDH
ncbi:hypothetical protein cypCar_00038769 [Cyprinus carpio]|nr:hypothetical protein cypCar_00038769 [Cyprinus carpio]